MALFSDLVLFPHCDVHVVREGGLTLKLRVSRRLPETDGAKQGRYRLTPVTDLGVFEFFAPHKTLGARLDGLPNVDQATGEVTATEDGVFLFQFRLGQEYIVGRLQVHKKIDNWWFGNDSITTALDPELGHAQPSIYARFAEDTSGTDLVGDITGHGYVQLTSNNLDQVEIVADGRLGGRAETADAANPPSITGKLAPMSDRELPVRVVDYGKVRAGLAVHHRSDLSKPEEMQNILLLSEGFTAEDEEQFNRIVTYVKNQLLTTRRHEPYGLLRHRFNVFSHFTPGQERGVTFGNRVTDEVSDRIGTGYPIPYEGELSQDKKFYTIYGLVTRVGLPKANETRPYRELVNLWKGQGLPDFDEAKVDEKLVDAWRKHRSAGILHARDTLFGLVVGARLADRVSGRSDPEIARPAGERQGPALTAFIGRVYEFYRPAWQNRDLLPDRRRHPPEIYTTPRETNPANSILRYAGGLIFAAGVGTIYDIGKEWRPNDAVFKRSRGLIGVIAFDDYYGGYNFNARTTTSQSVNTNTKITYTYGGSGSVDAKEMRRNIAQVDLSLSNVSNVLAHEFGHSFNLVDEYEDIDNDHPTSAIVTTDFSDDNATLLSFARSGGHPARTIDPAKVKWFHLPCIRLAAVLVEDSRTESGLIKVRIATTDLGKWQDAHDKSFRVDLQSFKPLESNGRQTPLKDRLIGELTDLTIADVEPTPPTLVLTKMGLPADPPIFKAGSVVMVPLRKGGVGDRILVVRKSVLDHFNITGNNVPLNRDTDNVLHKTKPDVPVAIRGLARMRQPSTLVGIFEGAAHYAGATYRPTGTCKMRKSHGSGTDGEFCYVCKWLIVNRVDPSVHGELDRRFYPEGNHD